jgi:hypothetical protein
MAVTVQPDCGLSLGNLSSRSALDQIYQPLQKSKISWGLKKRD